MCKCLADSYGNSNAHACYHTNADPDTYRNACTNINGDIHSNTHTDSASYTDSQKQPGAKTAPNASAAPRCPALERQRSSFNEVAFRIKSDAKTHRTPKALRAKCLRKACSVSR